MKKLLKLINPLAYAGNLLVACVWAYALVWGYQNDANWFFYTMVFLSFLTNIENVVMRYKVNQIEWD